MNEVVCSKCRANVVEADAGPYRHGVISVEPTSPRIRAPWFTAERKASLKKAARAWPFGVGLVGGLLFVPKGTVACVVGLLVILAVAVAAFIVPHKLGVAIARRCKWHWLHSNGEYDLEYGPLAWATGLLTIGFIPALYYLGLYALTLFGGM